MPTIGATDLDVFPLCLGGNVFGWTADERQAFAVLDAYADAGGNFLDTADSYTRWVEGSSGGESETIIGRWMAARGNRDRIVVATKVGKLPARRGLAPRDHPRRRRRVARAGWAPTASTSTTRTRTIPTRRSSRRWRRSAS